MKHIPNVTIVIVDCVNYGEAVMAITRTLEQVTPHSVLFFTDQPIKGDNFETVVIPRINSTEEYSKFIITEMCNHITTSHILIIQNDGFVLDGSVWTDEFLEYDYIGAPWFYKDGRNVGNGGFSLRSANLHHILWDTDLIDVEVLHPEDEVICRLYRSNLEKLGIRFAPEELAHQFAYECHEPMQPTFGFHGKFHPPYKEPIILKRTAAMGDIIMMEPVMSWFNDHGYRVIIDVLPEFFSLFDHHHYPVFHVQQYPGLKARTINLDMAYEINPKQLVLKSYYEVCGITDGVLKNAKLNFPVPKIFEKYVVFHIDDTAMDHRNVHGVDWHEIANLFRAYGYDIFCVGNGSKKVGVRYLAHTKSSMLYLMNGADFFIGIDSGPSQIAVGLGVESIIFFGSVDSKLRYADLSNIHVIQNECPIGKDGCYHSVVSVEGAGCEAKSDVVLTPPCITHHDELVIDTIERILYNRKR